MPVAELEREGPPGCPGRSSRLPAQVEFSQLTFRLANISVVITIEGTISPHHSLSLGQMMIEDDDDEREEGGREGDRESEISPPIDRHLFGGRE